MLHRAIASNRPGAPAGRGAVRDRLGAHRPEEPGVEREVLRVTGRLDQEDQGAPVPGEVVAVGQVELERAAVAEQFTLVSTPM